MFDLVLKGGRVIDPAQGLDATLDVAFADGKVAKVGSNLESDSDTRDVSGLLVVPGLIDLHTHVYWGGTSLGVDPDTYAKASGLTTLIDAGSAGPGNLKGFRRHVIEPAEVRILPFLNISFAGIFALSKDVNVGECRDLALINPRVCLDVAKADADLVVGIKVRVGGNASGASGIAPMEMALEVAEHAGLPLMTHLDAPPPYRSDVMPRLRKGDILTHCFRPFPNTPVAPDGAVRDDVLAARERGVIFDIGHGKGSFGYETAMAMLKQGFLPDVISSDIHVVSIEGPAYDLLTTMSKFLALGVKLQEVIRATTINPASAVRLQDRGTLRPGSLADATVLTIEQGRFVFEDVLGEKLNAEQRLACRGIVLGDAGGTADCLLGRTKSMTVVVMMGVSGSGKTTIAEAVAKRNSWPLLEGDKFHPSTNIEKMSHGIPLTDDDRWPWLRAIAMAIDEWRANGTSGVVACSALKRVYRNVLIGDRDDVILVYLQGSKDLIGRRMASRAGHFMPPALLDSQFATLEEPQDGECPIVVSISGSPDEIVDEVIEKLKERMA